MKDKLLQWDKYLIERFRQIPWWMSLFCNAALWSLLYLRCAQLRDREPKEWQAKVAPQAC